MKTCAVLAFALSMTGIASAQSAATRSGDGRLPVGIRFVATDAKETPGGASFTLTGGGADVAFHLLPGLSAAVDVAGTTISNVPGTAHGLSTVTLLAGPRYTVPLRRVSFSGQALFGAVHGFGSDFSDGTNQTNSATAFSYSAGGFVEIGLTHSIALRAAQVEYLQTNLPNGADNRQSGVRLGAGIVFRVRLPQSRR